MIDLGNKSGRKWMRKTAGWDFQREKGKESDREKTCLAFIVTSKKVSAVNI